MIPKGRVRRAWARPAPFQRAKNMKWFRLYAEFASDPKIQSMSETFQRRYIMFLCLKCNGELEKLTEEEICCALRISSEELAETKEAFINKGFIDENYTILAWDKRQYVSDNVTDRVKKHREKMKQGSNVTKTFLKQNRNVSVTLHSCFFLSRCFFTLSVMLSDTY